MNNITPMLACGPSGSAYVILMAALTIWWGTVILFFANIGLLIATDFKGKSKLPQAAIILLFILGFVVAMTGLAEEVEDGWKILTAFMIAFPFVTITQFIYLLRKRRKRAVVTANLNPEEPANGATDEVSHI